MTFNEAIAQQPQWVQMWLNVLFIGAFVLPLALVIWKESRIAGIVTVAASVASGVLTQAMYNQMGYVKLLGVPHIIFWVPVVIYLLSIYRKPDTRVWPGRVILVIVGLISISLAFDIVDAIRWIAGERTPTFLPA